MLTASMLAPMALAFSIGVEEVVAVDVETPEEVKKSTNSLEQEPQSNSILEMPQSGNTPSKEMLKKTGESFGKSSSVGVIVAITLPDDYTLFEDSAAVTATPPPEPVIVEDMTPSGEVLETATPASEGIPAPKEDVVSTALDYLGYPYVWAGEHPSTGFDCSGFTKWVYQQHGIFLPHQSDAQGGSGTVISQAEAMPGDLVVWPGQHVALYMGDGQIVHASTPTDGVITGSLFGSGYYFVRVA